jgi:hypothetical protein
MCAMESKVWPFLGRLWVESIEDVKVIELAEVPPHVSLRRTGQLSRH